MASFKSVAMKLVDKVIGGSPIAGEDEEVRAPKKPAPPFFNWVADQREWKTVENLGTESTRKDEWRFSLQQNKVESDRFRVQVIHVEKGLEHLPHNDSFVCEAFDGASMLEARGGDFGNKNRIPPAMVEKATKLAQSYHKVAQGAKTHGENEARIETEVAFVAQASAELKGDVEPGYADRIRAERGIPAAGLAKA